MVDIPPCKLQGSINKDLINIKKVIEYLNQVEFHTSVAHQY